MFNIFRRKNNKVRIIGNYGIAYVDADHSLFLPAEFEGRTGSEIIHVYAERVWIYESKTKLGDHKEAFIEPALKASFIKAVVDELSKEGFKVEIHE